MFQVNIEISAKYIFVTVRKTAQAINRDITTSSTDWSSSTEALSGTTPPPSQPTTKTKKKTTTAKRQQHTTYNMQHPTTKCKYGKSAESWKFNKPGYVVSINDIYCKCNRSGPFSSQPGICFVSVQQTEPASREIPRNSLQISLQILMLNIVWCLLNSMTTERHESLQRGSCATTFANTVLDPGCSHKISRHTRSQAKLLLLIKRHQMLGASGALVRSSSYKIKTCHVLCGFNRSMSQLSDGHTVLPQLLCT